MPNTSAHDDPPEGRRKRDSSSAELDFSDAWDRAVSTGSSLLGLSAVVVGVVFAIRVLFVSGFDPDVAAALATNTSTSTLLTTSALQLVPALLLLLAWLLIAALWRGWGHFHLPARLFMPIVILASATPFLLNTGVVEGALLLAGTILVGSLLKSEPRAVYVKYIAGAASILALVPAFTNSMWLPAERLTVSKHAITAYVLVTRDNEILVFLPKSRQVRTLAANEVSERDFCATVTRKTVGAILFKREQLPACPRG